MAGDRWASLAAHAVGESPDFFESIDPREPLDLLRESHYLNAIERKLLARVFELRMQHQAAGAGFTPVNDAGGQEGARLFKAAGDDYLRVGRQLLPYLGWPEPEADTLNNRDTTAFQAAYEKAFGVTMEQANDAYLRNRHLPVPEPPVTQ